MEHDRLDIMTGSNDISEGLLDRTLAGLSRSWRDVTVTAARSVGLKLADATRVEREDLHKMMRSCIEAPGGEVAARARTAELGHTYLKLDAAGRLLFFQVLAEDFGNERALVDEAIAGCREAEDDAGRLAAERALHQALVPRRLQILTQFNALPEGVKFLADLRADLLPVIAGDPHLRALEADLAELLRSWFDTGFLDLRQITWDTSAALLEKLIAYEAVHEIRSWEDLRNRLSSDRRLYALFHPRMPQEPLAFIEVALVKGLSDNIQVLLDETAPTFDVKDADSAIFYSITNTQRGLKGITFGDYLIKMVVQRLSADMPKLKSFATLSPVPGFRAWLEAQGAAGLDEALSLDERNGLRALGGADDSMLALKAILAKPDWYEDPVTETALRGPLLGLCADYFLTRRRKGEPIDPVARFHLRNGARLERVNWLGDRSAKGLRQSAGIMVNYRYDLAHIEKNHEAYVSKREILLGPEARGLAKRRKEGDSRFKRLGLG
jgi:malonyl-CoA decarboxylase